MLAWQARDHQLRLYAARWSDHRTTSPISSLPHNEPIPERRTEFELLGVDYLGPHNPQCSASSLPQLHFKTRPVCITRSSRRKFGRLYATECRMLELACDFDAILWGDDEITGVGPSGIASSLKVISKYGIGLATGRIETLRPAVLQNLCVLWPANYAENRNFCDVAFKVTFRLERRRN